jgi:hypothetical protein
MDRLCLGWSALIRTSDGWTGLCGCLRYFSCFFFLAFLLWSANPFNLTICYVSFPNLISCFLSRCQLIVKILCWFYLSFLKETKFLCVRPSCICYYSLCFFETFLANSNLFSILPVNFGCKSSNSDIDFPNRLSYGVYV